MAICIESQEEEDGYEDISSDDELNDGEETELIRVSNYTVYDHVCLVC